MTKGTRVVRPLDSSTLSKMVAQFGLLIGLILWVDFWLGYCSGLVLSGTRGILPFVIDWI